MTTGGYTHLAEAKNSAAFILAFSATVAAAGSSGAWRWSLRTGFHQISLFAVTDTLPPPPAPPLSLSDPPPL